MTPDTPVRLLRGVGDARAKLFEKLGVFTARDLLYLMPRRYEDRRALKTLNGIADGEVCAVYVTLSAPAAETRSRSGLPMVKAVAEDGTGELYLTFFNNKWVKNTLVKGATLRVYGRITFGMYGRETVNPTVEAVFDGKSLENVVPIYPSTSGMTQNVIRSAVKQVLALADSEDEVLTDVMLDEFGLMKKSAALRAIHFPADPDDAEKAKKRLAFEELLVFQLAVRLLRQKSEVKNAPPMPLANTKIRLFFDSLPFSLTGAQQRVIKEIFSDMERPIPMLRLVQGDVGSGKTVVAAAAIYLAVRNGCQAVMMAPTEILAEQHCKTLTAMLSPFGINVALLAGKLTAAQKRSAKAGLESGGIQVAVGTSALIQGDVVFNRLGLAVTDEQHRFGVLQRADLISKAQSGSPHTLVMSATPIPRTLSLILYGDLDISVIDELPPGRKPIETFALDETYRPRVNRFIEKEISSGGRVYVICPLVEENESLDRKSAEEHLKTLEKAFPNRRVALLHGKMPGKKKQEIMTAFKEGSVDILISTTVVEVGVDVPEASLMIVENAECFGLSGLHQLRGRIGRGKRKSYCILMYDKQTPQSRERLETMCRTSNGFEIAEADLKLRGPGDFFGSRQSGGPVFRTADAADMATVVQTRAVCDEISKKLSEEQYKPLYLEAKKLLDSAVGGNTIN